MMKEILFLLFWISICFLYSEQITAQSELSSEKDSISYPVENKNILYLSLNESVDIAIKNNQYHPAAQTAIDIVKAQYQQAKSGYWPQLSFKAIFTQSDQDPIFGQPSFLFNMPAMQLPIQIPPINVPEQNIKLMDKTNLNMSLNMTYPLYTGGMISSAVEQVENGVNVSILDARKTDLQIVYDIKRFYKGAVLASKLCEIGKEALERLEATLDITENLYKKGSGKVKKTDFLKNKVVVETARAMVINLVNNEKIAKAALINTLGLKWNSSVQLTDTTMFFNPYTSDLDSFIREAFNTNPDYTKMNYGIAAANAKIDEANSGYFPKIALIGNFTQIVNSYNKGYVTPENKTTWTLGLGMEMPLFSGFKTSGQVEEAKARLKKLQHEKILLEEGIALQIQQLFYSMSSAKDQVIASRNAMNTAIENRDLNERAYQDDLVEVEDLIQAQITEALMKIQYYKYLYDHIELQAHLDFIIGTEISKVQ
jgi:outer membrane protein